MPAGGGGKEEAKNDAHRGRKRCKWATKTYQHDPSVPVILVIAAGRQGKAQEAAEAKAEQQQEGGLGHRSLRGIWRATVSTAPGTGKQPRLGSM